MLHQRVELLNNNDNKGVCLCLCVFNSILISSVQAATDEASRISEHVYVLFFFASFKSKMVNRAGENIEEEEEEEEKPRLY